MLRINQEEAQEVIGITSSTNNEKAGSTTKAFNSTVENEAIIS